VSEITADERSPVARPTLDSLSEATGLALHDALTAESEERTERNAAEAAERIKRGQHWLDWMAVAEGLEVGRNKAMRRAGANRPVGSAYNKAFGGWLNEHKWARDLDKPTRSHLFWCLDHRIEIEAWRATLAQNERARLNHPTATKRRYEATHREAAGAPEPGVKETRSHKLEREIERLTGESDMWRKRAQAEGSLFDLKKDSVENIARVIAGNVSFGRLLSIQKALAEEIKRLRNEQKQAG
jgi:hypothetical protein